VGKCVPIDHAGPVCSPQEVILDELDRLDARLRSIRVRPGPGMELGPDERDDQAPFSGEELTSLNIHR